MHIVRRNMHIAIESISLSAGAAAKILAMVCG
jgi:hypothetical protein